MALLESSYKKAGLNQSGISFAFSNSTDPSLQYIREKNNELSYTLTSSNLSINSYKFFNELGYLLYIKFSSTPWPPFLLLL